MSQDIDASFIRQYESDVHMAYQRMGSQLGNTTRKKTNVKGESTTFQTVGTGTAGKKARNGDVPVMNINHNPVLCSLEDYYAADYIDKLDELKENHDERQVVAQSGASALGRVNDDMIVKVADTFTNTTAAAGALTLTKCKEAFAYFGNQSIPDDGNRYAPVSPEAWNDLLDITAFADADYVGTDDLPYRGGMTARRWLSFMWFGFSGLTKNGNVRNNLAYHMTAIGCASGQEVQTEMNYIPTKSAHLVTSSMSMGACKIDDKGGYILKSTES